MTLNLNKNKKSRKKDFVRSQHLVVIIKGYEIKLNLNQKVKKGWNISNVKNGSSSRNKLPWKNFLIF